MTVEQFLRTGVIETFCDGTCDPDLSSTSRVFSCVSDADLIVLGYALNDVNPGMLDHVICANDTRKCRRSWLLSGWMRGPTIPTMRSDTDGYEKSAQFEKSA